MSRSISPDGKLIVLTGFDDRYQGYQVTHLYVMNRDGSGISTLAASLDRDSDVPTWSADGSGLVRAVRRSRIEQVAFVPLVGADARCSANTWARDRWGRPYLAGSFTVSRDGRVRVHAWRGRPSIRRRDRRRRNYRGGVVMTRLNDDLFAQQRARQASRRCGTSRRPTAAKCKGGSSAAPSFDRVAQIPVGARDSRRPYAAYGDLFAMEAPALRRRGQRRAVRESARQYELRRGVRQPASISRYPGHDFDDLMSGVDAVIAKGVVDSAAAVRDGWQRRRRC
jgi:acylaminoacyl-peptidase